MNCNTIDFTKFETKDVKNLLSNGVTNTKTAKNERETLILYLSPAKQNSKGINLCPMASDGCLKACLYTAGRGVYLNVQNARLNRTELYLKDRFKFLEQIATEINKKAKKTKGELAVRLNGTSDVKLVEQLCSLYDIEKNVVFYDYTKIWQKVGERITETLHRYVVTFSRSENNEEQCLDILKNGGIVAMVFAKELPKTYKGFTVLDGDSRDDLMLDCPKGVILGLKAKGDARKDKSGFVITDY